MNGIVNERKRASGFTLVELIVVVGILAILTSMVVQVVGGVNGEAERTVAKATLQVVRDAFCGTSTSPGLWPDLKYVEGFSCVDLRVAGLLEAPEGVGTYDGMTRQGWRGAYVQNVQPVENISGGVPGRFPGREDRRDQKDATFEERGFYAASYGTTNDCAMADPWGNPIVLQMPTNALSHDPGQCWTFARLVSAGPDGVLQTPCSETIPARAARGDDLVLFLNRADVDE